MSLRGKKRSLAEQLAELSNPKPALFNPEDDIDTTPKICEFDEYEEGTYASFASSNSPVRNASATKRRRRDAPVLEAEENARYAGQAISRKDLDQLEEGELFVYCVLICLFGQVCMMLVMHSWYDFGRVIVFQLFDRVTDPLSDTITRAARYLLDSWTLCNHT